ncbi:MAG: aldehyde dehydrogenase family protein [Rhodospirillales bacterium]|nr:aldehyde dehydrogenase family protein [Rhodospirillales bacterium]
MTGASGAEAASLLVDQPDGDWTVRTPIDGSAIGRVRLSGAVEAEHALATAAAVFRDWRLTPAPRRGELIRLFGDELRRHKAELAALVTLESGKIRAEAAGEVQEMIDMCDFAVGLSRQLHGLTIPSERPRHRLLEVWHPLGPVGVITAFNFPVAVWAWNFTLALVCGNPVVWKPSEKTPMTALACRTLFERAARRFGNRIADRLLLVVVGGRDFGLWLARDARLALISATGSCRMGRSLAPVVASRFGRVLLELGGNNGAIVMPSANLDLAVRAILFAAVGTAGQRCTSLRRLFVHRDLAEGLMDRLRHAYASATVGDPRRPETLVGPLIDGRALTRMHDALAAAAAQGGRIFGGDRLFADRWPAAAYAKPALVEMPEQTPVVCEETFAPILYVMRVDDLESALALNAAVPQGLASAIFTRHLGDAERFLAADGSDCGIANVNTGPSGAEIGGAFGGEKATGGGREAGSDAWKQYMRRMTATINGSDELPLAQGINFDERLETWASAATEGEKC